MAWSLAAAPQHALRWHLHCLTSSEAETKYHSWETETTDAYLPQFQRLQAQDQGAGRLW